MLTVTRWCRRFINPVAMSGDLRSTQRSEAINSVLADRVKRNTTLVQVSRTRGEVSVHYHRHHSSPTISTIVMASSLCWSVCCDGQLFGSLNEFADQCRDKHDRRHLSAMSTSSVTSTAIEESMRKLRLPPFSFNKLVRQLDRSRTYGFVEVDTCLHPDGNKRVRRFQVIEVMMVVMHGDMNGGSDDGAWRHMKMMMMVVHGDGGECGGDA